MKMLIGEHLKAIFDGAKLDEAEVIYMLNLIYQPPGFDGGYFMGSSAYKKLMNYYRDEMPYGTKKYRTGDPGEWIFEKLSDVV